MAIGSDTQANEAAQPSWLDEHEQAAWRSFLTMHDRLMARLYHDLRRAVDLSGPDYAVLVGVSEAPGQRIRAHELGTLLQWEKSRLSKQITRMEERGLVMRQLCPTDARGLYVALTDVGRDTIERAAPLHVQRVRELFIGVLTREQLDQLIAISAAITSHLGHDESACDE